MQALDATTAWHLSTEHDRERVRDANPLLEAAARLVDQLPAGPLHLLTRNSESAAVVGAGLALRQSHGEPPSWQPVTLGRPEMLSGNGRLVLVEVAELGEGLRQMITERYPGVLVIDRLASSSDAASHLERAA